MSSVFNSPDVIVWGTVSSQGKFPLVFVEINAAYYREAILEGCLKAGPNVLSDRAN